MLHFAKSSILLTFGLLLAVHAAPQVSSLFIFKDPATSDNDAIKTTGFDTVVTFALNIQSNGDILYPLSALGGGSPDVLLVSDGSYVGGSKYADLMKSYKIDSTIKRVEATVGPYGLIQQFVSNNGTGASTVLYRNLAALKAAWNLDAINNDDEETYDMQSTVAFAAMVGAIGLKYSAAPYTNIDYWAEAVTKINSQSPDLFDRVYLQCYDGGAGNDPGQWQTALGIPITPILWVVNSAKPIYGKTPEQAQSLFTQYKAEGVSGGGYWNNYDIEQQNSSYIDYFEAIGSAFT
ncbi:coagulation factor 5/8 type domain-containing protein [Akanthomyces lecanii RCEF 1005]|uniref:Coagulation factor 5/8 type domain-containing protein n=1 Tax=Akanthomyces lecanii RCEF 1005 TaxID=1081108 RepID=A0A168L1U2_CORDF|nr:coagulation factor 5/8 type domain-containing protein [Akanthomyces lecanii RCEF 1005]